MNEIIPQQLFDELKRYLSTPKSFVPDPLRIADVMCSVTLAHELFCHAKVEVRDDPLQMGALIVRIEDNNIEAVGSHEINQFYQLIRCADNVEIYPVDHETVSCSLVFQGAFIREER